MRYYLALEKNVLDKSLRPIGDSANAPPIASQDWRHVFVGHQDIFLAPLCLKLSDVPVFQASSKSKTKNGMVWAREDKYLAWSQNPAPPT
jgi:hypothetical protein